jgi:hypothetical protein
MAVYKIEEESNIDVFTECLLLGKDHYDEVESKANAIPYNVNYSLMKVMAENGLLSVVTVRDEGKLVGYMGNLVGEDFFTSRLEAKELGIYLAPEARKGTAFLRMMKKMEEVMKAKGVVTQYLMFKEGHDVGLAYKLGYTKTETIYQKHLEG